MGLTLLTFQKASLENTCFEYVKPRHFKRHDGLLSNRQAVTAEWGESHDRLFSDHGGMLVNAQQEILAKQGSKAKTLLEGCVYIRKNLLFSGLSRGIQDECNGSADAFKTISIHNYTELPNSKSISPSRQTYNHAWFQMTTQSTRTALS